MNAKKSISLTEVKTKLRTGRLVSVYLFAYLLVSIPVLDVKWFNLFLCDADYYLMPAIGVTLTMLLWSLHGSGRQLKHAKHKRILLSAFVILFLFANFCLYAYLDFFAIPSPFKYAFFSVIPLLMVTFFLNGTNRRIDTLTEKLQSKERTDLFSGQKRCLRGMAACIY